MGFFNVNVDEDRIKLLVIFYYVLNVVYGKCKFCQYIINEIKSFVDNYKMKKVILYGVSEFVFILIGQLLDVIVLFVDYVVFEDY